MPQRFLIALSLLLLATTSLVAQSTAGSLSGQVTDSSGAALPGVTVELSGPAMQGTRTTVTDSQGNFRFHNVPPGQDYRVAATLAGFAPATKTIQRVFLGQEGTVNFTLRAALAEAITVTAEAPLVDISRTTTGVNVTSQQFESLPTQRSFQQLTTLAPGVTMEMGDTRAALANSPNVGASSAPENNYIIDGISTTDPRYGTSGTNLTMNFVEEVQVMTGGYSAEFGRSTGGVFNVITKSGGNDFHGDVFGYYSAADFSEARVREASKGTAFESDLSDRSDLGLSLGGPIMRDRLWFFGAFNPSRRKTFVGDTIDEATGERFSASGIDYETETDHYAGKLTFAATTNHNVVLTAFGDPTTREGWLTPYGAASDPGAALRSADVGSSSYNVRYSGIFGPNFLVEANLGQYTKENKLAPATETGRNVPRQLDEVNIFEHGGFQRFANDEATRDAYALKASNFFSGHELRYGVDVEENEYLADLHETWYRFFGPRRIVRAGTELCARCDRIEERSYFVQGSGTTKNTAYFLQDQWKVLPNFQLNLGVRYEEQLMESARGVFVAASNDEVLSPRHTDSFTLDGNWAPRLGVVWDPLNNGRSKVYASAGRFYEAIPLDINIRALNGEDYIISQYYHPTNRHNADTWWNPTGTPISRPGWDRYGQSILTAATATPLAEDLKAQYQDEWLIGAEYQFGTFWSAGARYVDRRIKRVIEDFGVFGDPTDPLHLTGYSIGNPGEGALGTGFDKPKRSYQALEMTLQRAFSNNWQLFSSLVYARAKGNYEGLYMTGYEQLDPNILALYDIPSFLQNAEGKLRADRPYQFKVHGSYRFPFGLTVSEGLTVSAGVPISTQGPEIYNGYGDGTIFLLPRGSAGRTPTFWSLDLHGDYLVPLFKGTGRGLSLIVDIFNALDNDETLEVDQDYIYEGMPGIEAWEADENLDFFGNPAYNAQLPHSPYYKTPIRIQAPRTVQLGVKFTF